MRNKGFFFFEPSCPLHQSHSVLNLRCLLSSKSDPSCPLCKTPSSPLSDPSYLHSNTLPLFYIRSLLSSVSDTPVLFVRFCQTLPVLTIGPLHSALSNASCPLYQTHPDLGYTKVPQVWVSVYTGVSSRVSSNLTLSVPFVSTMILTRIKWLLSMNEWTYAIKVSNNGK